MSEPAGAPPPPPPGYDPITEETPGALVRHIGARLTHWSDGQAVLESEMGPEIVNRQGVAHGGALVTLLDTAAGYAGTWCPYPGRYRRAFTLSLTTNFLAAGRGGRMITEARVTGGGRAIYFAEADVRDENGQILATAVGAFRYRTDSRDIFGVPREP